MRRSRSKRLGASDFIRSISSLKSSSQHIRCGVHARFQKCLYVKTSNLLRRWNALHRKNVGIGVDGRFWKKGVFTGCWQATTNLKQFVLTCVAFYYGPLDPHPKIFTANPSFFASRYCAAVSLTVCSNGRYSNPKTERDFSFP